MSLVKRIDALCKERNTTLTAIERECGLGVSSIRKWDEHSPSLSKVILVADALGVSMSYLIDEQQKKPIPEDGDGLNEEQAEIVKLYEAAPPALRAAALAVLKSAEGQGKAPGGSSTAE